MPRYVETTVKLSKEQAKRLKDAITSGSQIALTCSLHESDETPTPAEALAKLALTPLQRGRVGAGKAIKLTPAQSKYMRGAGFLVDAAKVASAVGQKVADEFVPDSKAANTLANILLESAEWLERGLTGKPQFDYGQAAKNRTASINKAKAFLGKSREAQQMEWRRLKNVVPVGTFEEFYAGMQKLAKMSPQSAKQVKETRLTRMRGDPVAQAAASKLVDKGKDYLRSKDPELFDMATGIKKAVLGRGKRGGALDVNALIADYLRNYIDADSMSGNGRMKGRQ
jgi:hypothetical protein